MLRRHIESFADWVPQPARAADVSVAVLCDIHGNLPALDAVLAELRADPPEAVVIGGDVAAGPMPVEVLARLRASCPWPVHWLRGNADRALVMSFDGTVPPEVRDHPDLDRRRAGPPSRSRARSATSSTRSRRSCGWRSTASATCCSATAPRAATRSA